VEEDEDDMDELKKLEVEGLESDVEEKEVRPVYDEDENTGIVDVVIAAGTGIGAGVAIGAGEWEEDDVGESTTVARS